MTGLDWSAGHLQRTPGTEVYRGGKKDALRPGCLWALVGHGEEPRLQGLVTSKEQKGTWPGATVFTLCVGRQSHLHPAVGLCRLAEEESAKPLL